MTAKKPRTYVAFILDQSGSMEATKAQSIQGYNELVQQMKKDGKDQDIKVSLITFNGNVFEHLWCQDVHELAEASPEDYVCSGSTALFDAWGYAIQKFKDTTDIKDENNAYLLYVITDGHNNASTHHTAAGIGEEVAVLEKQRWTFNLMGCSKDYLLQLAKETHIPISNCAVWANQGAQGAQAASYAMGQNVRASSKYFESRKRGMVETKCFYSGDETSLADFTSDAQSAAPTVQPATPVMRPAVMPPVQAIPSWQNMMNFGSTPMIVPPATSPYLARGSVRGYVGADAEPAKTASTVFRSSTPVNFDKKTI